MNRVTERERETDGDRQLEEIDTQTGMERQRSGEDGERETEV